jgi:nodulation protein E
MAKRVVITGMGCVSGLGADVASTWRNLAEGKGAIRAMTKDAEGGPGFALDIVGAPAIPDAFSELGKHFNEKQIAAVDLFSNFAAAPTLEALKNAGLLAEKKILDKTAIIYGSASGGNASIEIAYRRVFDQKLPNIHPMSIPRYMNSASVSHLSMLFGIRGHCLAVSSACASSAHAIAEAMYFIRSGRAKVVVTGGSDASLTYASLLGWKALQAMAPDSCRPFSQDRKGMVIGEGGATLVLEDEEHAKARGAPILAEVAGAGSTADARHITQPDPENAAAAILEAHADAGIGTDMQILYSAHGTGTRLNDKAETIAIKTAYPKTLGKVRVIATKSAHGHMLGGTGAMEFMIGILAMREGIAPPILNYLGPDPECDLPLALKAEPFACDTVVSSSFAFGGLNSVLIGRRV